MAINLEDFEGDMNVKQNIEDSEVDKETLDISGKGFGGSANVEQTLKGVKSRKAWVWGLIALGAILVPIAGYYFSGVDAPVTHSATEELQQVEENYFETQNENNEKPDSTYQGI